VVTAQVRGCREQSNGSRLGFPGPVVIWTHAGALLPGQSTPTTSKHTQKQSIHQNSKAMVKVSLQLSALQAITPSEIRNSLNRSTKRRRLLSTRKLGSAFNLSQLAHGACWHVRVPGLERRLHEVKGGVSEVPAGPAGHVEPLEVIDGCDGVRLGRDAAGDAVEHDDRRRAVLRGVAHDVQAAGDREVARPAADADARALTLGWVPGMPPPPRRRSTRCSVASFWML